MWTFTIEPPASDPISMSSEDLTAGEDATIYAFVCDLVIHDEHEIGPQHCPVCRSAIATTALVSRAHMRLELAQAFIRESSRADLAGCFRIE